MTSVHRRSPLYVISCYSLSVKLCYFKMDFWQFIVQITLFTFWSILHWRVHCNFARLSFETFYGLLKPVRCSTWRPFPCGLLFFLSLQMILLLGKYSKGSFCRGITSPFPGPEGVFYARLSSSWLSIPLRSTSVCEVQPSRFNWTGPEI